MGVIDDKKNVFTTIGAYVSFKDNKSLSSNTNLFTSINNKNDIGAFLIDILGVVAGTNAIKQLVGELFSKFVEEVEPKLKESVIKQLIQYNSGDPLASKFKTTGINVNVKDVDTEGRLRNDPSTTEGELIYGTNSKSFDRVSRNAITNEGNEVTYNNLLIKYNSHNDTFTYKPTIGSNGNNIGDWFTNLVNKSEFINKKQFSANILNSLFGSITANGDSSVDSVFNLLKIEAMLDQIMIGVENPSVPESDFSKLYDKANQLVSGKPSYDMGCGLLETELSLDDLADVVNTITNTNDPNTISNAIDNAVSASFDGSEVGEENSGTIKNGFFARLVQLLQLELAKILVTSPQARMLLAISTSFQNNGDVVLGDVEDDLVKYKTLIRCIIKDALALLYKFIFNLIVSLLVALLVPIIKRIIVEKINAYIGIVKSLISSKL